MATAALVLGIIGGCFGLLVGLFGYSVAGVASAAGHSSAWFTQLISVAIPVAGLVGGGVAKVNAVVAGVLMLLSACGMFWVFGFNFFTAIPLVLTALGGVLALVVANQPK